MSTDSRGRGEDPSAPALSAELILLLNRAMLVMHSMRTAAHELNNVFQMIGGSAELLDGHPALAPALKPRVEAILRQSGRGEALVRRVADLARRVTPGAQPVDLLQAVEGALEARRFEHGRSRIAASVTARAGTPWVVYADPQDVQQIVLSLIVNAEQALADRPDGSVAIELSREGETLVLTVADNGRGGLPADPFVPFVTTRPPAIGAGLGLAAAHLIAARMGGSIDLRASAAGAAAVVRIPAHGAGPL